MCTPSTTLGEVLMCIREARTLHRFLVIQPDTRTLVGIISLRDVLTFLHGLMHD
jgi:CBS domain-containing protein